MQPRRDPSQAGCGFLNHSHQLGFRLEAFRAFWNILKLPARIICMNWKS